MARADVNPVNGMNDEPIETETARPAGASVIWLHGLGADGHDFEPIIPELDLPPDLAVRFVFPHAPFRPVTLNGGYVMRAWYDIVAFGLDAPQDETGIRASAAYLRELIARERRRGVAANRIVLAGFSQGGAIALHTALRYPEPLCGVLALSTYLPLHDRLAAEIQPANRGVPVFMAHGTADPIVPIVLGELSRAELAAQGVPVAWHEYPMGHTVIPAEIEAIAHWLIERLDELALPS